MKKKSNNKRTKKTTKSNLKNQNLINLFNNNFIKSTVIIIIILVMITIMFGDATHNKKTKKEKDRKELVEITDKKIIAEQVVDGIKLTPTLFVVQDGISRIIIKVSNNTGSDYSLKEYTINVKDKDNKILASLPGYIGETIKNKEEKYIDTSIDRDLTLATKIEYKVEK